MRCGLSRSSTLVEEEAADLGVGLGKEAIAKDGEQAFRCCWCNKIRKI